MFAPPVEFVGEEGDSPADDENQSSVVMEDNDEPKDDDEGGGGGGRLGEDASSSIFVGNDRAIAMDLLFVAGALSTLKDEDYFAFVRTHVFPSQTRTDFFIGAPWTNYLMSLSVAPDKLVRDPLVDHFRFLLDVIRRVPAETTSLVCSLMPMLNEVGPYVRFHVHSLCDLLFVFVRDSNLRPLMLDHGVFHGLAYHVRCPPPPHEGLTSKIVQIVLLGRIYYHRDLFVLLPIVRACARLLERNFHLDLATHPDMQAALVLLEQCACVREWKPELLAPFVQIARRRRWDNALGQWLVNMIAGTASVDLLLELHEAGLLDGLRSRVAELASVSVPWTIAQTLLRKQWPAKFGDDDQEEGEEGNEEGRREFTHYECPITLHPCVHPVAASDGRVYERNAILQHLVTKGKISPMTNQVLEPYLYDLYA